MKTMLNPFKSLSFLLLVFATLTFTSCDKDDVKTPLTESIEGVWDVTSYKLEGDEYIGLIFEEAVLGFEATVDNEGVFTQEVTFTDDETVFITGPYVVDEEENDVYMEYDGEVIVAHIEINDGKMVWDGTQDGFPLVLKATRR